MKINLRKVLRYMGWVFCVIVLIQIYLYQIIGEQKTDGDQLSTETAGRKRLKRGINETLAKVKLKAGEPKLLPFHPRNIGVVNKSKRQGGPRKTNITSVIDEFKANINFAQSLNNASSQDRPKANLNYSSTSTTKCIIYNRVPKCGSLSMTNVIQRLGKANKFKTIISQDYVNEGMPLAEQFKLVETLAREKHDFVYDRHFYFLDFSPFNLTTPTYINLVRHPIDRFLSHYLFHQKLFKDHIIQDNSAVRLSVNDCVRLNGSECFKGGQYVLIPYICGQNEVCRTPSNASLELAKKNIEQHFAVIGLLEDMEQFLKLLECELPEFFRGAYQMYHQRPIHTHKTAKKVELTQESRAILSETMALDIQLYNFIKVKFLNAAEKYSTCLSNIV